MNNEETIFLAKIQQLITVFDEIDDILDNISDLRSKCDLELSDYYHIIENNGRHISNDKKIEIFDKIEELRKIRRSRYNISELGKVYRDHSKSLFYKNNRDFVFNSIKNKLNSLHKDYNYRILESDDVIAITSTYDKKYRKCKNENAITKEKLEECIDKNMTTKEIAEYFGKTPSNISHFKKKYGISTRKYTKKS